MKTEMPSLDQTDTILQELRRLNVRVAALEAKVDSRLTTAETAPISAGQASTDELSEELILVIGAAVAAFLGEKAHIRQVTLIGSVPWMQQGRAIIQASHTHGARTERMQS